MALLKSTNDIPGVNLIEYRDHLYYNKYTYRARVTVEGIRRGYYWSGDEFELRFKSKTLWGKMSQYDIDRIRINMPSIKKCLNFRQSVQKDKSITVRFEGDTLAVFHNDLQFLHDNFDNMPLGAVVDYTMIETSGYEGVKTFVKEPKHKFRVYLKTKKPPADVRPGLRKVFESNTQLRPSPALKHWVKIEPNNSNRWWSTYFSSHHFIDYNDESYLSYLSLMYGEFLGKKYKLQKRPDTV